MMRRLLPISDLEVMGDREVRIRMTTSARARDGHILEPGGCVLENYRKNPIQLFQHDPTMPVGTNDDIVVNGSDIEARCTFAPAGISPKADEVCGLVKAGIIRAVSIGFDILDAEPIDPARPRAGLRASKWELLECSFVSVPADVGAIVTARSAEDWKCGASRTLPIEDSDDWNGSAAEASIFEWAGGDDFDAAKARKGFLAYNAAAPKLRGSYKLPIAHVVDGRLKVPKGAIRAAASRLPQADIPDDVRATAGEVLDHYKEKADMADDTDGRAFAAARTRIFRAKPALQVRGLNDVAWFASLLGQFGWLQADAKWEAEIEGDNSQVPALIGTALKEMGDAFLAMAHEEVQEMLNGAGVEIDVDLADDLATAERSWIKAAPTPRIRAWRYGIAKARAGKTLSTVNMAKLDEAGGHLDKGAGRTDEATGYHGQLADHTEALADAHARATTAHEKATDAFNAIEGAPPEDVTKAIGKIQNHHKAIGKHLATIGEHCASIGDVQADAQGAIAGAGRSIRAATRCVRAVTEPDTDTKDIQTSAGVDDSDGAANGRGLSLDARQRRAALLALADAP